MTPSAIVLNVCCAAFLVLSVVFTLYVIAQARKQQRFRKVSGEAKQIPLYAKPQVEPLTERKAQYQLAEVE